MPSNVNLQLTIRCVVHNALPQATDEIELVTQVIGRDQFPGRVPSNLDLLMRRFNEVQYWATTEVLLALPQKRVTTLRKFIKIAMYAKENRDLMTSICHHSGSQQHRCQPTRTSLGTPSSKAPSAVRRIRIAVGPITESPPLPCPCRQEKSSQLVSHSMDRTVPRTERAGEPSTTNLLLLCNDFGRGGSPGLDTMSSPLIPFVPLLSEGFDVHSRRQQDLL
ncbi:hypothetical protein OSTOST_17627 [Ostertagia ostertagi]